VEQGMLSVADLMVMVIHSQEHQTGISLMMEPLELEFVLFVINNQFILVKLI
jgi:hypothetical protein